MQYVLGNRQGQRVSNMCEETVVADKPTEVIQHQIILRWNRKIWEVSDKRSGRTVSTACHVDERLEDVEVRVAQA